MKIAILAALALVLAACGSSTSGKQPAGLNPVDVLRKIPACQLPSGVAVGDRIGSVRYASCTIPDPADGSTGDEITAYTSADKSALQQELTTQGSTSTDSTKIIVGDGFFLTDTGEVAITIGSSGSGIQFIQPPETVAAQVSGTLR